MHLAIDASNIRQGGGLTHLTQLLSAANPGLAGIARVGVWAGSATLAALPERPWLDRYSHPWLDRSLPFRLAWQRWTLPSALASAGCDLLLAPGGSFSPACRIPTVAISQNMLPFESDEAARFGRLSAMRLKMRLLRASQSDAFRRAAGVIFLSAYARDRLVAALRLDSARTALVPHGIEPRFFCPPRPARNLAECSPTAPFRLLYVSIQMPYKHQIEVARAVARLRADGLPLAIDFVGAPWGVYGAAFAQECTRLDPTGDFLRCSGEVPFTRLHALYQAADGFVFASSCENLPNIMIEAMAAGLPILSSDRGPMPEVLGDAGSYFDPCSVDSIVAALLAFAEDRAQRTEFSAEAYKRARAYSWQRCADDTFAFIARTGAEMRR